MTIIDEPYRLVPDETDPLTIEQVRGDDAPHDGTPLSGNVESAKRAAAALSVERSDSRDDAERVQDLLSDMFHLCDLLGLDMDELVNRAQRHYGAEIKGEL